MIKINSRKKMKDIRHRRVRNKIFGSSETPRLSVFKSLKFTYVQVIDDSNHETLFSCSSLTPKLLKQIKKEKMNKVNAANISLLFNSGILGSADKLLFILFL